MTRLSDRERQVLRHVADGAQNDAIAQSLGISIFTVKAHMRAIFDKTGAANRVQLAVMFVRGEA